MGCSNGSVWGWIINWNKGELDKIDWQTGKLLNMHRGLHPRSSVDRLYTPRTQGGRGLLIVKDCVELERSNLLDYAANNNERLLKAATEALQLRTKMDGKNKEERENERHCMVNSWGNARSKEVAMAESRWAETGSWKPYMCCPRTST